MTRETFIVALFFVGCARPEIVSDIEKRDGATTQIDGSEVFENLPDTINENPTTLTWKEIDGVRYYRLSATSDEQCSEIVSQSNNFTGSSGDLEFPGDGEFFLCMKGFDIGDSNVVATSKGVSVVVDTTFPTAKIEYESAIETLEPDELSFKIRGDDVSEYRYKFGLETSTDCELSDGYTDSPSSISTQLSINAQALVGKEVRLCVVAADNTSNWQPFSLASVARWTVKANAKITSIAVNVVSDSIAKGVSTTTAIANYSNGSNEDITASASFSSDDDSVLQIDDTNPSDISVLGVAIGTTQVVASFGGVSGSTAITVTAAELASLQVSPASNSLADGTTVQLTCTGIYTDSSSVNLTNTALWSEANAAVATVDNSSSKGLVTAQGVGSTTITADVSGTTATSSITVTSATLSSVSISPTNTTLANGTSTNFLATGVYSDSSTQNVTTLSIWSSSNTGVATIATSGADIGKVTSVGVGASTIQATFGGQSDSTVLTVTAATLDSITITPPTPSIAAGSTRQFTATGNYSDSSTQDLTSLASWSTSAAGVATIDNSSNKGLANAISAGSTTITATYGGQSDNTSLTVTAATLSSITISPIAPSIAAGTAKQFFATGTYSDSSTQDITDQVAWTSSNTSVASISNASSNEGLSTSVAAGSTTITATLGAISSDTVLTVTSATLSSLAITPSTPSVALGSTQQFSVVGTYSDSSTQDLTTSATWTSSATGVATVDNASNKGKATAVSAGNATITAAFGGQSDNATLTITAATLSSIAVTPPTPSIAAGTDQQFTATGTYSDSSTQDITPQVSWTSSDTDKATVSNSSGTEGLSSGIEAGSSTITAALSGVTGNTTLTVTNATLTSISVTPATTSIKSGLLVQLTATGNYSDSSTQDITLLCSWSSDNLLTAIVSNILGTKGLVTTVAIGSANITCSYDGKVGIAIVNATLF